ncbi:mammalian cell entry protein [Burkholderia contaminans FFH2055]|uniref:PqiB family protein n=1 Tax=Burkholderia contaminans TaxID=488447 RepID=UPI000625BF78|nr:MlaD family protein [Burkholderia contaminans]KKL35443.1 mammalian cell entry protein [Burkholderia contaminans FFH2055]MEB4639776.1 MlaD family protein [Burkholderia contaminans]MEB4654734.1 MlaD family protein [Burkholderia contaminans]MEB4659278.1 MlaD family protein [Burkholderia contaminans]MEB4669674.1 MlaD family protein [Burkholderia contaminans]
MNPPSGPQGLEPHDPPVTRNRLRLSLVWLVPLVAALIGLSMVIHAWLSVGPEITITFNTAQGLEAGKTPVKYKDVVIGTVTAISLSDDSSHVVATVSFVKNARNLIRDDTRFWVVRPRVGMSGVSGIDTLFSGAYIGMDTGRSAQSRKAYTGLETPPTVINGMPGTSFALRATDLGSLDIGSPVYYRHLMVGHVASYKLDMQRRDMNLQVFVDAPYDRLVTTDTRFWNASGMDLSLDANGLKLKTQSVATIVGGGIAFATPDDSDAAAARAGSLFMLADNETSAMAAPDGPSQLIRLRFEQPLRGLAVGAPVEFSGINMGKVVSTQLDFDRATRRFQSIVMVKVYPYRLGPVIEKLQKTEGNGNPRAAQFLAGLVEHGLRAQARTGNLLTEQLYISFDFVKNAPKVPFDANATPLTLPTVASTFDKLPEQLADIVDKINKLPLESIGKHVDSSLTNLDATLRQVNGQLLPSTTRALDQANQTFGALRQGIAEDGPLQENLANTLTEVQRTARSLRTLTDMLGRRPDALLRGTGADHAPIAPVAPSTSPVQQEPRQP